MSWLGDIAKGAVKTISGGLINFDKIEGIPTPRESGSELGSRQLDYLNTAFPGTTPVERLGHGAPTGQVASSEIAAKNAKDLQERELSNRSEIADKNNLASVITATAGLGPGATQSAITSLKSGGFGVGGQYDTPVGLDRERLNSHLRNVDADTRAKVEQAISEAPKRAANQSSSDYHQALIKDLQSTLGARKFQMYADSITRAVSSVALPVAGLAFARSAPYIPTSQFRNTGRSDSSYENVHGKRSSKSDYSVHG